ncbi:ScbR family autoregulator-binding transcription factor [Streptomyces sp. TRM64462]|uniref:ScbR family autoregulator-binding transcription factor n=1 Tax=Streptomyces sp. TRM64462 TaxID=2741726 RepID=UPI0020C78BDF|nr:ScbR family autoregulator-binding transcription factor [Streptomyces sp. TRM64462]
MGTQQRGMQQRAVRTRNAVLEAAAEIFADHGYEAATITDILERAGVTKGALYFHFSSKEDLAQGVLDHAVTEPLPEQPVRLQGLVDVGLVLAHRLPREPLLRASARLAADQGKRDFFGSPWHEWVKVTAGQLTEAKDRGEVLSHVDPESTAQTLVGSFTGIQLVSQAFSRMADLDERVAQMYALVMPAIATPAILGQLDMAPSRGARLFAEQREQIAEAG